MYLYLHLISSSERDWALRLVLKLASQPCLMVPTSSRCVPHLQWRTASRASLAMLSISSSETTGLRTAVLLWRTSRSLLLARVARWLEMVVRVGMVTCGGGGGRAATGAY